MSALIFGFDVTLVPRLRVYRVRLADNEAVLDQLPDVLSAVCGTDLSSFVGVKPDLLFAAFQNRRGQAEIRCVEKQIRVLLSTNIAALGLGNFSIYTDALSEFGQVISNVRSAFTQTCQSRCC